MNRLAGKFSLLSRQNDSIYVGLVGNVTAESLSEDEVGHLFGFYKQKSNEKLGSWRVIKDDEPVPECRFPRSNYNGGIVKINIQKEDE